MSKFIPLSVPNLKGNELTYVTEAIETEWVSTGGAFITEFEKQFALYAGTDAAVACQSGTAALHLALICSGVGAGDLVIAPTLTFVAAVNPIAYVGAEPVFMDCDDTLCMDIGKLEKYLTQECGEKNGVLYDNTLGKPVRAIVAVHVFGNRVNMERLMSLAEKHCLTVIEDATEAVGTFYIQGKYKGRMLGTIGDIGAYSFNGNKIITTGGGGMLTGRDPAQLARAKHLSTQAKANEVYFEHDEVGYNYRMTNLQAALGVAQLEQLEGFIETKKGNYYRYIELGIPLLPFCNDIRPNYWFYSLETDDRDGFIKRLAVERIQTRPIWKLIHMLPMYMRYRAYEIEKSTAYYNKTVNIPCSSNLSDSDLDRVAKAILR